MTTIALVLAFLTLLLVLHDLMCSMVFILLLLRARPTSVADDVLPKAAVLMGLKGVDPDLHEGLRRLMQQNYPNYELHVVVDHATDPASQAVLEAVERTGANNVHLEVYQPPAESGAVNATNSKLMQSLRRLDRSIEIVAMADGDLVPPADWLRELVAPLVENDNVAATWGNRWFMPTDAALGSHVRYLWNAAASVSMYLLNIPWGGCFAIKMSVVRRLDLAEKWSRVVAFDAATPGELARAGLQLKFVPTLIMLNREQCRLSFCVNFFQRQLTWTRLYHPAWPWAAGYALIAGLVPAAESVALIVALVLGEIGAAYLLGGAIGANLLAGWLVLPVLQFAVERVNRERSETGWLTWRRFLGLLPLIPLTQAVQMAALLAATFRRRVDWRGITLEIHSPQDVRMVDYAPFRGCPPESGARESL